ncbi:MAG: hypothetical protein JKY04_03445, partial [Sneathiella sp.]|nr:hypothetical protein [Sneathiella sp.]
MPSLIKYLVMPTVALFVLAGCQTTDTGSETVFTPIKTASAFDGGVVGKKLILSTDDKRSIVIAANHTWAGTWGGKGIGGNWM